MQFAVCAGGRVSTPAAGWPACGVLAAVAGGGPPGAAVTSPAACSNFTTSMHLGTRRASAEHAKTTYEQEDRPSGSLRNDVKCRGFKLGQRAPRGDLQAELEVSRKQARQAFPMSKEFATYSLEVVLHAVQLRDRAGAAPRRDEVVHPVGVLPPRPGLRARQAQHLVQVPGPTSSRSATDAEAT